MSWRTVVITKSAKLSHNMGYLVVRDAETLNKIHMSEISVLILENTAISITSVLLCELVKRKIKVIFCDEKRNPISEILPYYGSHDSSIKIKHQTSWSEKTKQHLWTEIIEEKIRNQAALLRFKGLSAQAEKLDGYIDEMEFNDETNREGHAAKVYFNALFGKDFSRQKKDNPINAALDYGYSIILSCVNREIAASGYLTQLGLHHDNMFNSFNLGCDLMEPLRPFVDYSVTENLPEKFEHDEKKQMLALLEKSVRINGTENVFLNAIGIYCRSIFNALNDNDASLIRFINYEL